MLFYKKEREKSKERRLNREERKGERGGERERIVERGERTSLFVVRDRQKWRRHRLWFACELWLGDNASSQLLCHPSHYCTKGRAYIIQTVEQTTPTSTITASPLISDLAIEIDCNSFCDLENARPIFVAFVNAIMEKNSHQNAHFSFYALWKRFH